MISKDDKEERYFLIFCGIGILITAVLVGLIKFMVDSKVVNVTKTDESGKVELVRKLSVDVNEIENKSMMKAYSSAVDKMNTGSFLDARHEFEKYIQNSGKNKTAHYFLGHCIVKGKKSIKELSDADVESAKKQFEQFLDQTKDTDNEFRVSAAMYLMLLLGESEDIKDLQRGYDLIELMRSEIKFASTENQDGFYLATEFAINALGSEMEQQEPGSGLDILENIFIKRGNVQLPCTPQYLRNYFNFSLLYIERELNDGDIDEANRVWKKVSARSDYLPCAKSKEVIARYSKLRKKYPFQIAPALK